MISFSLSPGQCTTLNLNLSFGPSGNRVVYDTIDPSTFIPESNEGNLAGPYSIFHHRVPVGVHARVRFEVLHGWYIQWLSF
jgi:hypothetical protein